MKNAQILFTLIRSAKEIDKLFGISFQSIVLSKLDRDQKHLSAWNIVACKVVKFELFGKINCGVQASLLFLSPFWLKQNPSPPCLFSSLFPMFLNWQNFKLETKVEADFGNPSHSGKNYVWVTETRCFDHLRILWFSGPSINAPIPCDWREIGWKNWSLWLRKCADRRAWYALVCLT